MASSSAREGSSARVTKNPPVTPSRMRAVPVATPKNKMTEKIERRAMRRGREARRLAARHKNPIVQPPANAVNVSHGM